MVFYWNRNMDNQKVILYDGGCKLCLQTVRQIRKLDSSGQFYPVAFQSTEGQILSKKANIDPLDPDSVVLFENGVIHEKSDAVLTILRSLKGTRAVTKSVGVFPQKLLDKLYDLIARHRSWIFGRTD